MKRDKDSSQTVGYIKKDDFIKIALACNCDPTKIVDYVISHKIAETYDKSTARQRVKAYRNKGLLPLESGNKADAGTVLKGTSTLYDKNNNIVQQWVKTDVPKESNLNSIIESIQELVTELPRVPLIEKVDGAIDDDLATLYISNDIHFGLLTWDEETGTSWDTEKAVDTMKEAYDYLFSCSPNSSVGIIVDLGDLTEADDFSNLTPHGKNPLDTDSRYPKVLKAAHQALRYAIMKALQKHEIVYFYNIAGNHDVSSGHAVREVIAAVFEDNERVIVCGSPAPIKYHQHGKTLIGFAHGDGMKMNRAGETMAIDCQDIFSSTSQRFFHFGHTHVDAVRDGAICRCESHRNVAPLNAWAHHKGFRRGCGTMKSITYSAEYGEVSRNIFNVTP